MELKQEENGKKRVRKRIAAGVLAGILAVAGGIGIKAALDHKNAALETARLERNRENLAKAAEAESEKIMDYSVESGIRVFETIKKRPAMVDLPEEHSENFITIESCLVDNRTSNISLEFSTEGIPKSDDDYYYLFALRAYMDGVNQDMTPSHVEYKAENTKMMFSHHFGMVSGMLYKYVVAVKEDGRYVVVSNPCYVTNPEEIAVYKSNGESPSSKKGLLVAPDKIQSSELDDLGVKHAAYNIQMSRILELSEDSEYPPVSYTYNGKDYLFDGQVMAEYDMVFSTLTEKGIEITAILLNDVSATYPEMIHPLARSGIGNAPYYAFNAAEEEGMDYLAAITTFLSERYSGKANGRGVIANWVIGNEINARKQWNYMRQVDLETYVREYVKAFRICYSSIKSVNSACRVYIPLDQQWNNNAGSTGNYNAKDILDEFNRQIRKEGNIDWGLAIHPYNVPLDSPYIWKDSVHVQESEETPMVTMANIDVVTDYLQQEEFLTADGEVRSVILSELGYTSLQGEELQAAAIVYAYKKTEENPHIDSVLFSRQTDAEEEMEDGLALGINHLDGTPKYVYKVFKYMDTPEEKKYTDFAKEIIGISEWF